MNAKILETEADRRRAAASWPDEGPYCELCGQRVPVGFRVCYDCDLEMDLGEWLAWDDTVMDSPGDLCPRPTVPQPESPRRHRSNQRGQ